MTATRSRTRLPQDCRGAAGKVVVGVDDSPGGLAALRWAVEFARSGGVPLVAVRAWALGLPRHGGRRGHRHVVFAFGGAIPRQQAAELTRRAFHGAAGGIPHDLDVVIQTPGGEPGPILADVTSEAGDVLVVGTRGSTHSLKRVMRGSVSAYCAEHARCPVVVVSTPGSGRRGWSRHERAYAPTAPTGAARA